VIDDSIGNGLQWKPASDSLRRSRESGNPLLLEPLGTHWIPACGSLGQNDGQAAHINQTGRPFAGVANLRKHR
jgi:hypothetical protein